MLSSPKEEWLRWNHLTVAERMLMLTMAKRPVRDFDWLTGRKLCFYGVAEITPKGLKLTWFGRHVLASSHGLPVVVGRRPVHQSIAGNMT
jgi:hypothetical protein